MGNVVKVYIHPTCVPCSRAMYRVTTALRETVPLGVKLTDKVVDADFQVLHAISMEARPFHGTKDYAVIQYCTTHDSLPNRGVLWGGAKVVWSYYQLDAHNLYHAPLGVDPNVFKAREASGISPFRAKVVTSGYVTGAGAEAIWSVAEAATKNGLSVVHIGPSEVQGMRSLGNSFLWKAVEGISDARLADIYSKAHFVSALRYLEGFELPAIEAMSCGTRPVVFDQPALRHWYGDFADFLPELGEDELVPVLEEYFAKGPRAVLLSEIAEVRHRFDWKRITTEFWERVMA